MLYHQNGNVLHKLVSFNGVMERKVLKWLQIETKYYISTFLFCFILPFSSHLISFQLFYYFNMSWHLEHVDIIEMFHPDVCKLNYFKILTPHPNARWKQMSKNQRFVWVGNSAFWRVLFLALHLYLEKTAALSHIHSHLDNKVCLCVSMFLKDTPWVVILLASCFQCS